LLAALTPDIFSTIAPRVEEVQLARGFVIHDGGDAVDHVLFIHDRGADDASPADGGVQRAA
jgi:hypothetical protein